MSNGLQAQNDCYCCEEQHSQFDFWIGEWEVVDSIGTKLGENRISNIEGNCIISEHWTGAKGYTGSSYNYYDKSDSTWNQLWIDNRGNILKLKGRFEGGSMVLRSELTEGTKVDWYYNQISWTENRDGTVSQIWEVFDKNHKLLTTVFSGIYVKKE